jgi:hypothetical protein
MNLKTGKKNNSWKKRLEEIEKMKKVKEKFKKDKRVILLIVFFSLIIPLATAIYQGETESIDKSSEFTTIDSYAVIENTSAIPVTINGTIVSYTIPEDYEPGTFKIRLYGWVEERPVISEIKGGGGDGGCITTWKCSDWSSCSPNSTQIRTCTKEKNYCYAKPTNLTQKCTYTPPPAPTPPPIIELPIAETPSWGQWTIYLLLGGIIFVLAIIIGIYFWIGNRV